MTITDIRQATEEAEADLRRVDSMSNSLAKLLVGRLKHVTNDIYLKELKKELRKFNIHTGRWAEQ